MSQVPRSPQNIPEIDGDILNALYEHIAVLDLSGKIVFVNEAWKRFAKNNGYANDTYGLHENYIQLTAGTEIAQGIQSVLDGQMPHYSYEYPCHSPNERRWFWLYITPLLNTQQQITGAVTSHINITERKLAERAVQDLQKQLLQSERSRVLIETAGGAAHEINQPLTAVIGLAELMIYKTDNLSEDDQESLVSIYENAQLINKIVQKMQQVENYVSKPYIGETRIVDFEASSQKET